MSRYLVSRPYFDSNIGSNLSSLAGAAWLAARLGRELIVDWRGLTQLRDPAANYFTEFFDAQPAFLGVPAHYAPTDHEYAKGTADAVWLAPAEAAALATVGNPPERYLVLEPYHGLDRLHPGPEAERFRLLRSFYRRLVPATAVARAVDTWAEEHLDGAFVVGVNIRTGNGHYFGKGMAYAGRVDVSLFADGRRFLRLLEHGIAQRLRGLPRTLRAGYRIFYATDSAPMSSLLSQLPNAVTRRAIFPPPNTGDTFRFEGVDYNDRDSIVDTLADMFLLARCDALLYNSSLFNQYARVLTGYFSGNHAHIELLSARRRAQVLGQRVRRRLS